MGKIKNNITNTSSIKSRKAKKENITNISGMKNRKVKKDIKI